MIFPQSVCILYIDNKSRVTVLQVILLSLQSRRPAERVPQSCAEILFRYMKSCSCAFSLRRFHNSYLCDSFPVHLLSNNSLFTRVSVTHVLIKNLETSSTHPNGFICVSYRVQQQYFGLCLPECELTLIHP